MSSEHIPLTTRPPEPVAWPGRSPEADRRYGNPDPLKIVYLLVMDEERPESMTAYQGFGRGWEPLLWAFAALTPLPATVLEPAWPTDGLLDQRIGGVNHQHWLPLTISALELRTLDEIGFCAVVFTGTAACGRRASDWIASQRRPVLHVSSAGVPGAIPSTRFGDEALRAHCGRVYGGHAAELSTDRAEAALAALGRWTERERTPVDLDKFGHNCVTPNHMVLRRAFRTLGDRHPHWMGLNEAEYTRVIVESVQAVIAVRRAVPRHEWRRIYDGSPAMILTEPSLFRHAYNRGARDSDLEPATKMMIRRMQRQTGLLQPIAPEELERLLSATGEWQAAVQERKIELAIQTLGVGLFAAQSCSPVVRLRPEVNLLSPRLSEFARNVRTCGPLARRKRPQLLRRVQDAMARAVGPERIGLIKECGGPIKIVSDAPLELLPVDGLPLALRYDTSRINATPGNLMMGQLAARGVLTIMHDELTRILVISAFAEDDPLRDEMANAVAALERARPGRFRIDFVRVGSVDEFVSAMNDTDAPILIFDGHGSIDRGGGVGGLRIGAETVDVWSLRPRTHSPPIVVLSACDTHGLDAPSHATAGNSFLALGATTVLGTVLPVGGREAALFVYRLLLHLAEFVPAAIAANGRALTWTEIMAGTLRLTLSKDILDHLVTRRLLDEREVRGLFHAALVAVIDGGPQWFERFTAGIEAAAIGEHGGISGEIDAAIGLSEATRYVQLGAPERISIGSRELVGAFFPHLPRGSAGASGEEAAGPVA